MPLRHQGNPHIVKRVAPRHDAETTRHVQPAQHQPCDRPESERGKGQRVAERPNKVRVRVADKVYELRAATVTDAAEKGRVVAAYQAKYAEALKEIYGRPSTADDFELLYRLTPRS